MSDPVLLQGQRVVDDRGCVDFVNAFNLVSFERFYTIRNHRSGFIRAWHGHRFESKAVTVIHGAAVIGAVKIDNWQQPGVDLIPHRFVLCEYTPAILQIPAGYANGFKTLLPDTVLLFFSSATLGESKVDDYRYSARHWNIWEENER